jgi:ketosteroid isomerase-like protein
LQPHRFTVPVTTAKAIFAACAIGVASAADAQTVTTIAHVAERPVTSEVAQARYDYVDAVNGGESDKIVAFHTEDALIVLGEKTVLRGKAGLARHFAAARREPAARGSVTITPFAFVMTGNHASETGSVEESTTVSSRDGSRATSLYVIIYSRGTDGRWRIAMEVRGR